MAVPCIQVSAAILANEGIAEGISRMSLAAPELAQAAHAGHFVNVFIPGGGDWLWRRPFSVHAVDRSAGSIELLFNTAGRASQALSRMRPGVNLEVLGLLGNTFSLAPDQQEIIIVAGGLGIAPFRLLLQDLIDRPIRKTVFFGAASAARLCCLKEMSTLGADLHVCTEDGSRGEKGLVTLALERYLQDLSASGRQLFVCGPTAMMQQVQRLAKQYGFSGQVTVENRMACGFGACMGCPVEMRTTPPEEKRYSLACKDGPVFSLDEIIIHD